MKTEQTTGEQMADKPIDFRKDTPPTDWLAIQGGERYINLPDHDFEDSPDYLRKFIDKLSGLRCEPVCANGQLAPNTTARANGKADSANGRLAPGCICSLVEQLASSDVDLLVPSRAFFAIVRAAGYSFEDTLKQYRNYVEAKLWDKYGPEFKRLCKESDNTHNWWMELQSDETFSQALTAENELDALERKIDQELEAIMSS